MFMYEGDSLLNKETSFGDSTYFEAEVLDKIGGSKVNPMQVALLISEVGFTGSVLGVLPSVQVLMQTSSAGGSLYRASLSPTLRGYLNPSEGVFALELLVANSSDSAMRKSLGQVTLVASRSVPVADAALPRIDHQFKPPSPRSNWLVTLIFVVLVIALPLGSFVSGLKYLRLNTMGLDRLSGTFFVGVACFVGIIAMFFLALNLVQTVALTLVLCLPMCVAGNKLLCQMRTRGDLSFAPL